MRKRLIVAVVAILALTGSALVAPAQVVQPCDLGAGGDYSGPYPSVSEPGPYTIGEQQIVELDSELDGVTIQMALLRPNVPAGVKVPVIATAGPYYHALQTLDLRACESFLTENYVPQGYAVAVIAVRGTGDSGGCMNLFGPGERADLNQAITWLGTQAWSTGSVGMIGLSYDGGTPWEVASFGNPYLKTIVPLEGVPDLFQLMYRQGRIDFRGPLILNALYYQQSLVAFAPGRSLQHTIEVAACPEYATGLAASAYSSATGRLDPFGFWAERRFRDEILANYHGSVYMVQGLLDWNVDPGLQYPWIWELESAGITVKHLLGQWGHQWPFSDGGRQDWADVLLNWFDRWLKDDLAAPTGPKYEIEDSDGGWRAADSWPDGPATTFWLDPTSTLSTSPSSAGSDELVWLDPFHTQLGVETGMPPLDGLRDVCLPGCALFQTPPLAQQIRFGALPSADLEVTPLGPGGQLTVYVYESLSSEVNRLGWGQFDLRFQDGSDEPQQIAPGETLRVRFDLQPLDAVVHQGARLIVIVSGGTAWNRLPTVPNYPMMLHTGGAASSVTFPTVEPDPSDFFFPPSE